MKLKEHKHLMTNQQINHLDNFYNKNIWNKTYGTDNVIKKNGNNDYKEKIELKITFYPKKNIITFDIAIPRRIRQWGTTLFLTNEKIPWELDL